MTSSMAELPAQYGAPNPQAVTTPSRPISPMNAIGEGATPLMYACQQSRDQDVRRILAKKVAQLPHQVQIFFWRRGVKGLKYSLLLVQRFSSKETEIHSKIFDERGDR